MSADAGAGGSGGAGDEIGDHREKHVSVDTRSGDRIDHGDVYFRYSATDFAVCPDPSFPEAETVRYEKASLLRVEVTQHHAACFITAATTARADDLDALRGFRDDAMGRTPAGRALVALYYVVSPPVARTLRRHPRARTAGVVRWLVERCADLARRRDASRSRVGRLAASTLLTVAYAVGLVIALVGHALIRGTERLPGGSTNGSDRSAAVPDGSSPVGSGLDTVCRSGGRDGPGEHDGPGERDAGDRNATRD